MLTILNQGRELSRKRIGLRILALAGLVAIILAAFSLLAGCSSESSTPGQSVKGKTAPTTAKSEARRGQTPSPLLVRELGSSPEKVGPVNKQADAKTAEMFPELNQEEMAARMAEERKKLNSPDSEVLPGLTKKEAEAKKGAKKNLPPEVKKELFFGMSPEELNDKMAAGRERYLAPGNEVLPGLTMEEYQARQAAAAAHRPDPKMLMETFPGNAKKK